MSKKVFLIAICLMSLMGILSAQNELAATLEVLQTGVSVQRVNTSDFITIKKEAIVGVGDVIKTDGTGRARVTFFADGTETELQPNTEYSINQFQSDGTSFQLTVEVLIGQTTQRLGRILDANSFYNVKTSGMTLAARGTVFLIRVEDSGRSGMLVTEGTVNANQGDNLADVPPDFGIRAEADQGLSDVVKASTFEQLDAALDGCTATLRTVDDVSLNVRISPSSDSARVGTIGASEITRLFGVTQEASWYRIAFRGGFGWVLSSTATIEKGCAGLRVFPKDTVEDASLYTSVDNATTLDGLQTPAPETTPEAGS